MVEVLNVRRYRVGYEIRTERWRDMDDEVMVMKNAYTHDGLYIGSSKWAHFLMTKKGIRPEKASLDDDVCSIGFCEGEQKWYGWSHRAICGFGIGDVVSSEDHLCATSGWTDDYLEEHPEENMSLPIGFRAKTLEDAKRMAIAFADAVS